MTKQIFKDACDICGTFAVCKGYEGKVLCPECLSKQEELKNGNKN